MPHPDIESALEQRFNPVLDELLEQSEVAVGVVDKDFYRILISTLWVNVVLDPGDVGLDTEHLEALHDVLNRRIADVLGCAESLTTCFRYLNGKQGDEAMKSARLTPNHRDMLLYFASIILDPDGHRRWMDEVRNPPSR